MAPTTVDDFEDGDITVAASNWSGWSGDTAEFSADSNSPIAGTYSGQLSGGGASLSVSTTRDTETTDPIAAEIRSEQTSSSSDAVRLRLLDGSSTVIGDVEFADDGDINFVGSSTTLLQSWSASTVYEVAVHYDGTDVYVYIDGTKYGAFSPQNSASGAGELTLVNDTVDSFEIRSTYIDNVLRTEFLSTPTLSLDSQDDTSASLSWTDVSNETGYEVYRSTSSPVSTSDTLVASPGADTTTYTDTGLDSTTDYYYAVRAVDSGDRLSSDLSNEVQKDKGLVAPTLSLDATRDSEIDLSWNDVENAEDYEVYRDEVSSVTTSDTLVTTTTGNTTTYTDTGLENGERYYYRVRALDSDGNSNPSDLSNEVDGTTTIPAPTIDSTTADSQSAITVAWTLNDNSTDGDVDVLVDASVVATVALGTTSYQATGFSEATTHDFEIRRNTDHTSTTAGPDAQYTKPSAPSGLATSTNEKPATHSLSWTDNSGGEDGYDILESRDGGSQTAVTTGLAADTTTHTTDRQDRTDSYEYQVRAFVGSGDDRAESLSGTASASFPSYDNYWAVIEETDGTTTILTDTIESGPEYEHTALHGFTHALRTADVPFSDWGPLTEIEVFLDSERLFFGELVDLDEDTPTRGATTVDAHGPGQALTRTGPDSKVTFTNTLVYKAIEDYIANQITSVTTDWTVFSPPGEIQEDDTRVLSDSFSGFSGLASPSASDPFNTDSSTLSLEQTAFIGVENDFGGTYTVSGDNSSTVPHYIDAEYADLGNNDTLTYSFTPDHDIPASRVAVCIHGNHTDAQGTTDSGSLSFNSTEIVPVGDVVIDLVDTSQNGVWARYEGNYSGGDLSAGTTYTVELTTGDYAFNIDALGVYDTDYTPGTFDTPDSQGDTIDGPQLFQPVTVDLTDENRTYTIKEARVESTVTDVSNGFAWDFSVTGGASSITKSNTADATFDFFGNSQYGTTLEPAVTLDGYGSNSWLADGVSGQEISSLDIYVTTTDVASIASIELTDSHFRNLQRLHDAAGMRWVVDPAKDRRVDGIVAESFAPDAAVAEKSTTWTQLDASRRRQMDGYANAVTINYIDSNGDDQQFVGVADSDEVNRVGEEVRKVIFDPSVETNDQARNAMLNARRDRIGRDQLSGTVRAVAEAVLPGYRYDITDFGGYTSLNRTRYTEAAGRVEMTLQFERDDDVLRRVLDTQSTVDTVQERL